MENENLKGDCAICGGSYEPESLNFMIKGLSGFVCPDCLEKKTSEIAVLILESVFRKNRITC